MSKNPTSEPSPLYEFNSATARKLADIGAVSQDLTRALSFLTRLVDENDTILQDALFTAALITYRRCFNSGTRLILSKSDIVGLHPQALEIHEHFMAMADKFAAHSVNAFEQVKAGVIVVGGAVAGVGVFSGRLITFDKEGLQHWALLISLTKNKIAETGKAAEAAMFAEAQSRPVSEIIRAPTVRINAASDPKKARDN